MIAAERTPDQIVELWEELMPNIEKSMTLMFIAVHGRSPRSANELGGWVEECGRSIQGAEIRRLERGGES